MRRFRFGDGMDDEPARVRRVTIAPQTFRLKSL